MSRGAAGRLDPVHLLGAAAPASVQRPQQSHRGLSRVRTRLVRRLGGGPCLGAAAPPKASRSSESHVLVLAADLEGEFFSPVTVGSV